MMFLDNKIAPTDQHLLSHLHCQCGSTADLAQMRGTDHGCISSAACEVEEIVWIEDGESDDGSNVNLTVYWACQALTIELV